MSAPRPPQTQEEWRDWLRLARSQNVGPVAFQRLLARYGSAAAALEAAPHLAARGGRRISLAPRGAAEAELEAGAKLGARPLALGGPDYPPLLAHIPDPPPFLWLRGRPELPGRRALAVVGTRNASALGMRFTQGLARALSEAGFVIVSGMAEGIDRAAHAGGLEGGTLAVLGGGPDDVYPRRNADVYAKLIDQGAVLSEAPPGFRARAQDFPRRNRIVSGICLGTIVTEAAERSGSLITARLAAEQGREVMAAPGAPLDGRAAGCNHLIREGATLIRHAADVLEALEGIGGPQAPSPLPASPSFMEEPGEEQPPEDAPEGEDARSAVLRLLGPVPVEMDEIRRRTGLPPGVLALAALELELAGRLLRSAGDRVALAP
ncbi:DNA-processing protein DprA [Neomegalonema sp.]|uniref:DNA-processing protein DprA n=1 Tax=Neomegalonema sp. TaxID=2039713 RepID=UPI002601B572|nr:DNA-processing protein DprA [Neomegalonema sp.]MDD2868507.1 DNA-processing protein DprA [Neomegalonema sp.]